MKMIDIKEIKKESIMQALASFVFMVGTGDKTIWQDFKESQENKVDGLAEFSEVAEFVDAVIDFGKALEERCKK